MDLNDTAAFVTVGRLGSFTKAADRLGVPKGTVSRQVARLEQHLGARLLQRTTRSVSLTDVGRAYYERCRHAVESIENAERLVADVTGTVTGTVRVSAPFDFAIDWLVPWLPDLRERHPELRVELELSQRRVDLIAENIDVALRGGGALDDSGLVARKLASSALQLCATPAYLKTHGTPHAPEELASHQLLGLYRVGANSTRWKLFGGPKGEPIDVDFNGSFAVNDLCVLRDAIRAGMGIGLCERTSLQADIKAKVLRRVLPDYELGGGGLWAVYPSTHHLSPKVRAFVDFMADKISTSHA